MLYYSTIASKILELLKKLQATDLFKELRLVGGTGLALQYGHRKSIDIDLFGKIVAKDIEIVTVLREIGDLKEIDITKHIKIYTIDGIKVDIVNYPYGWLQKPLITDNLIIAQTKDIAAMKLAAITNRGSKKDFIDLYFILQEFSFKKILDFYSEKYPDSSKFMLLKSLSYFDDAEDEPMLFMIKDIKWFTIKEFIKTTVEKYIANNNF